MQRRREWRKQMNNEILREARFYDNVEVEIRTSKGTIMLGRKRISAISLIRKVDLVLS